MSKSIKRPRVGLFFLKKTEAAWPGLRSRKIERFSWRKIKNVLFKILLEHIEFFKFRIDLNFHL